MKIHSKRGQDLKELLTACDAAMKGLMMTLFLEPTCRLRSCNRQFAELIQIGLLAAGVDASALLAPVIEMDRELLKPKPADPPRHAAEAQARDGGGACSAGGSCLARPAGVSGVVLVGGHASHGRHLLQHGAHPHAAHARAARAAADGE